MNTTIKIGGHERKIQIDYSIFYDYEAATGRTAQNDAIYFTPQNFSIQRFSDFIYCALAAPIRETGGMVDFTPRKVADWLLSDVSAMEAVTKLISDAFGVPDEENEGTEEKKIVPAIIGET
jgi:hypothetical protein